MKHFDNNFFISSPNPIKTILMSGHYIVWRRNEFFSKSNTHVIWGPVICHFLSDEKLLKYWQKNNGTYQLYWNQCMKWNICLFRANVYFLTMFLIINSNRVNIERTKHTNKLPYWFYTACLAIMLVYQKNK